LSDRLLESWGFQPAFAAPLAGDETYARVIGEQKTSYTVITGHGELSARLSGRLLHPSIDRLERPVVGDWLAVRVLEGEKKAVVQRVLPRKSLLRRRAAGTEEAVQPLAANVDLVFAVTSLNRDLNLKRLDRYLTIAHESGSRAAILLTKKDLEPESEKRAEEFAATYKVPCLALAALAGDGLASLRTLLKPGETVVFVGSSGVGKSTIVNSLLGREEQATAAVRSGDDRGRHTTTARRLLRLECGALVIDTPGIREIQLEAEHEAGISASFPEIEALALRCRFSNCRHESEPGCAVKGAIESGALAQERYESYLKLQGELADRERKALEDSRKKNRRSRDRS
jgi:ribosome biogenesis GTPase / thiamine phosphate phosphatase